MAEHGAWSDDLAEALDRCVGSLPKEVRATVRLGVVEAAKGARQGGAGKADATAYLRGEDQDGPAFLDKGDPNYDSSEEQN